MSMVICSICWDGFCDEKTIVAIECGHVYHELCLNNWKKSLNTRTCPDCRVSIGTSKRVYLNTIGDSNRADGTTDDAPISNATLEATINGLSERLHQYEIKTEKLENVLTAAELQSLFIQNELKAKYTKIKQLEKAASERNRALTTLQKELRRLEANVKAEKTKKGTLQTQLADKDQTIKALRRQIQSMAAKSENHSKQSDEEMAEMRMKLMVLNKCIDALQMREQVDQMVNRRLTRSRARSVQLSHETHTRRRQKRT